MLLAQMLKRAKVIEVMYFQFCPPINPVFICSLNDTHRLSKNKGHQGYAITT